jgi:hypothetical protein
MNGQLSGLVDDGTGWMIKRHRRGKLQAGKTAYNLENQALGQVVGYTGLMALSRRGVPMDWA